MASTVTATPSAQMSPGKWQTRLDLAACCRLVALHDWPDMLGSHISAAHVPGVEDH
ncbi:MAG TPA: hypothetical protein VKG22_08080 [Stellaceae bacterium]|nr:hypothetical protein [Stellaceae bacterium]HMD66588.1 hypothetical protein [Stellaceae bacterium]